MVEGILGNPDRITAEGREPLTHAIVDASVSHSSAIRHYPPNVVNIPTDGFFDANLCLSLNKRRTNNASSSGLEFQKRIRQLGTLQCVRILKYLKSVMNPIRPRKRRGACIENGNATEVFKACRGEVPEFVKPLVDPTGFRSQYLNLLTTARGAAALDFALGEVQAGLH